MRRDRPCPDPDCRQHYQTARGMARHLRAAHDDCGRWRAGGRLVTDGGTTTAQPTIADPEASAQITDDDPATKRALAVVVWTIQGRWDLVEAGCLSLLGTARRKRGGRS